MQCYISKHMKARLIRTNISLTGGGGGDYKGMWSIVVMYVHAIDLHLFVDRIWLVIVVSQPCEAVGCFPCILCCKPPCCEVFTNHCFLRIEVQRLVTQTLKISKKIEISKK